MTSGGARVRSGPMADPNSGHSERVGYRLQSLPNEGYTGDIPDFPLAKYVILKKDDEGNAVPDRYRMTQWRKREMTIWGTLWRSPQACAWSLPQYGYLVFDIAMYCRQFVICESSGATASDRGLLPRYADRIGLSAAGLAELGWKIMPDELALRRMGRDAQETTQAEEESGPTVRRRLRG